MPMRIIPRGTLRDFWERRADAVAATWETPQAIKERYRHASFVADRRVIFNIGGNTYRLIAHMNYDYGIVLIKFIGTHSEYDRIDPETVNWKSNPSEQMPIMVVSSPGLLSSCRLNRALPMGTNLT